jgi:hypothetical protein
MVSIIFFYICRRSTPMSTKCGGVLSRGNTCTSAITYLSNKLLYNYQQLTLRFLGSLSFLQEINNGATSTILTCSRLSLVKTHRELSQGRENRKHNDKPLHHGSPVLWFARECLEILHHLGCHMPCVYLVWMEQRASWWPSHPGLVDRNLSSDRHIEHDRISERRKCKNPG